MDTEVDGKEYVLSRLEEISLNFHIHINHCFFVLFFSLDVSY